MTTYSHQVATDEPSPFTDPRTTRIVQDAVVARSLPARTPLQEGDPRRAGRYRLTARLGSGGMGVVYLGLGGDGHLVAVKVLRPELADDPEFRARFGREMAVLARVRGARIVRVIEAGTDDCGPFLVTEYAAGPSLTGHVEAAGPLGAGMLHDLAAGLAEALTVIHAAGVVHRDLKPANVILAVDGPKLIDFGIAQALDSVSLTQTGMTVGSAGFMAPEQVMGQAGPAADIFAWAVTIAYAASGRPPFGTGATDAVVYRILHAQPSLDAVPHALRPLVEAALAKEPQDRPTAHEILDQLAVQPAVPAKDGTPVPTVLAPPVSRAVQPGPQAPPVPVPAAPGRPRPAAGPGLTRRRTAIAVPAVVLAVVTVLALVVLAGRGAKAPRPAAETVSRPLAAGPFGIYPGQQDRGVFQTISRIGAFGKTIVTTGSQVSDGIVRQQFFTSADGGASWRLAPVRTPGGGQPPLGYQATRLAGGPSGWVAIGTAAPEAIWTSRNGLSWTLAATHGIAPQLPGDQVFVLTSTADGFLAAGQAAAPEGKKQAVIWTSRDGVTWQRMAAAQLGLAAPGQSVQSISWAASAGEDTVISGTLANGRWGTWLSSDGGSTWTPVTVPAGHGAEDTISGLASYGSGLIAVRPGTAGDGIAYFSPNGRRWQYAATVGAAGGLRDIVVKGSGYGFAVTGTDAAGNDVAYTSTGTGSTWLPTGSLGPAASYASVPAATAGTGDTVIAAGSTAASKVSQQAVLLQASTAGAIRPVPLGSIPGAVVPEVTVKSLAVAGGQQIAVGSADGYPAIWRKVAGRRWQLVSSLSLVSAKSGAEPGLAALASVTHGPAGWLAVGVPGPVVLTSADGATWQPATGSIARDLASVTGNVVGVAAAAGPDGYVIVGKVVEPGGNCAADVWWSPNLARWTRAHNVNDNDADDSSQVLAVAAGPNGFVSAGSYEGQLTALAAAAAKVTAIGSAATPSSQQLTVLTLPAR